MIFDKALKVHVCMKEIIKAVESFFEYFLIKFETNLK